MDLISKVLWEGKSEHQGFEVSISNIVLNGILRQDIKNKELLNPLKNFPGKTVIVPSKIKSVKVLVFDKQKKVIIAGIKNIPHLYEIIENLTFQLYDKREKPIVEINEGIRAYNEYLEAVSNNIVLVVKVPRKYVIDQLQVYSEFWEPEKLVEDITYDPNVLPAVCVKLVDNTSYLIFRNTVVIAGITKLSDIEKKVENIIENIKKYLLEI